MPTTRQPTLQTIADAASVSRMTVSRALRNDPVLPPKTRERIQGLASTLGYRPNPLVATLMSQVRAAHVPRQTLTIAHVTTTYPPGDWRKYFFTRECIEGATQRAAERGFTLEEFCIKEPGMTGHRMSQILRTRGIRGVLIGKQLHDVAHLTLDWQHFAAVALGYSMRHPTLHRVCADCMNSVKVGVRQLRRAGYRRIGMVTFDRLDLRVEHGWMAGFLAHQYMAPPGDRVPILVAPEYDQAKFVRWYRKHRPEAILGCTPHCMQWLRDLGVRVPEDVGFVLLGWWDKLSHCAYVDFKARVIGASALDLIVAQLHRNEFGIPSDPLTVLVQSEWVNGKTVRRRSA